MMDGHLSVGGKNIKYIRFLNRHHSSRLCTKSERLITKKIDDFSVTAPIFAEDYRHYKEKFNKRQCACLP